MNTLTKSAATLGMALALGLYGSSGALAKAHDNGVADGERGGSAAETGQTGGVRGDAVSGSVKGGQRGGAASAAGSDNNGGKGNRNGQQ